MAKTLRVAGHLARVALGLIFLAAGVLKAVDPAEFAHQIAGYGLIGSPLAAVAAPALIVFEIALGVALVSGVRPLMTASASILLLLLFIGIEAYGIAAGRTESCGCFGAYLKRTPGQVIVEDLLFIGLAVLAIIGLRGWAGARPARAAAILIAALCLSTAFVLASPSLPIDDVITRLRAGRTLADLDLAARLPQLAQGRHLVALIDVTDPRAAGIAAALDALASSPNAPAVIGLTPSSEQEVDTFRWTVVPAFEIKSVERDVIKRLYRKLPRYFVLDSGRVVAVYDGAPPEARDLLSSEAP
jgi:putative oxidoreductase